MWHRIALAGISILLLTGQFHCSGSECEVPREISSIGVDTRPRFGPSAAELLSIAQRQSSGTIVWNDGRTTPIEVLVEHSSGNVTEEFQPDAPNCQTGSIIRFDAEISLQTPDGTFAERFRYRVANGAGRSSGEPSDEQILHWQEIMNRSELSGSCAQCPAEAQALAPDDTVRFIGWFGAPEETYYPPVGLHKFHGRVHVWSQDDGILHEVGLFNLDTQ